MSGTWCPAHAPGPASPPSPWAAEIGCPARCATDPDPRVPLAELARRYAALTGVLPRSFARGDRLADPRILRSQARAVLGALGVRLEAGPGGVGRLSAREGGVGTLVVANHISWLDVVALLAVEPVHVLAKREVGRWPVVGALARRAGTRFIDREGSPRQLPSSVAELARDLRDGTSLLVFPQATTWCAAGGGRFRRAVFQAAVDAGAPVRPVTIEYRQRGAASTAAAFLGDEDFTVSLRRVAAARGLTARITVHDPLLGADRRALADAARAAVTGAAVTRAAAVGRDTVRGAGPRRPVGHRPLPARPLP
ncbi:lysophospholipid acyltransferase family protein [Streptomyces sp. NPDC052114]|uniref:lysophospholipid acyltransferase family protein n=1 Tax=unclassified Streptomyces TaxID=2593676 RepID=UPI0034456B68